MPEGRRNAKESGPALSSSQISHSLQRMTRSVHLTRAALSWRRATKTARVAWTNYLIQLPRELRDDLLMLLPPLGYLHKYQVLEVPLSRLKGAKRALDRLEVRVKELPLQVGQDKLAENRSER